MFEDEVEGFIREVRTKVSNGELSLPGLLMIEDEGMGTLEEMKRLLDRMDIGIQREENKGVILDVRVEEDQAGNIRFWQKDHEFDLHHFYFVLRRNGYIRIDTLQIAQ